MAAQFIRHIRETLYRHTFEAVYYSQVAQANRKKLCEMYTEIEFQATEKSEELQKMLLMVRQIEELPTSNKSLITDSTDNDIVKKIPHGCHAAHVQNSQKDYEHPSFFE